MPYFNVWVDVNGDHTWEQVIKDNVIQTGFLLSGETADITALVNHSGAAGGDPSTMSFPSQWNPIGTTRGEPSRQT